MIELNRPRRTFWHGIIHFVSAATIWSWARKSQKKRTWCQGWNIRVPRHSAQHCRHEWCDGDDDDDVFVVAVQLADRRHRPGTYFFGGCVKEVVVSPGTSNVRIWIFKNILSHYIFPLLMQIFVTFYAMFACWSHNSRFTVWQVNSRRLSFEVWIERSGSQGKLNKLYQTMLNNFTFTTSYTHTYN